MTIAQSAVEPIAEDIGISGLVEGVDAPGELVEGGPVIKLTLQRGERLGKADWRVLANCNRKLLGCG